MYNSNIAYLFHWFGGLAGLLSGLIFFKDKRTNKSNLLCLIFGSNGLSIILIFLFYNFIKNWPAINQVVFFSQDMDSCCYQLLIKNNTIGKCYI